MGFNAHYNALFYVLNLINYACGNKPKAWPHLGHMDTPLYPGIQTHVVGYPNTCVWKSISKNNAVLERRFITFHDKSLFAVNIYVYIAVHKIYVY